MAAPGAHASAWVARQSVPIANGRTAQPPAPQIGVDAAGNAVLAMLVDKGPPQYVQVAGRPVGGDWGAATELGTATSNTGGPALAVDPAGHALVVWVDSGATAPCNGTANACLHVVSRSPAGALNTETLFTNGGAAMFDPAVALDPSGSGQATIVWRYSPSAGLNGVQAIRGSIGGTWPATASPVGATTTSTIASPRVAIDGSGTPVAWFLTSVTGQYDVRSSTLRGTTWTATGSRANSTTGAFSGFYVKTNKQGNIDAIFSGQSPGSKLVQTITWDAATGGFPNPAQTIYTVASTHNLNGPKIETASDGEAVAVWTDDFTSTTSVRSVLAAVRSGGAWSGPQTLDPNTVDTSGPALAMDAAGNATAVWHSNSPSVTQRYAVHPHGGSFGASLNGPNGNSAPVVAADAAGHVHAAWALGSTAVDTAVFDPVPPTLSPVGADPLSLFTGGVAQLDVTATDAWSGPPAVQWDFGDGQSAGGSSVAHTFSTVGAFTPTATATDSAGNSSTSSGSVQVSQSGSGAGPLARPLGRPVAGQNVNLEPVTGIVLVKVPGTDKFVPLVAPTQVRDGSIIDARKGRVRITIDNGRGGLDTADFYGGIFRFTQPKVKAGQFWFANLYLYGGSFKGCPGAPRDPKVASLSRTRSKRSQGKSVRQLWGSGEGAFRTVGRFSSATVRGTTWLTNDKCNGTLTKVTAGKVGVRDFVLNKTIVVKKGKSYFAQPKPRKTR
ncbi:MAG TPA: PKD domain-containing protein [Thermoleophilaceae bacterium]